MKYINRPPHLVNSINGIYFITGKTAGGNNFWAGDERKNIFLTCLNIFSKKYSCGIYAWAILDNHYHLLLHYSDGPRKFISALNGKSAIELNKKDNRKGRKIWWNYWDHSIRDEADFYKHFNYINNNPIKHGFAANLEELENYKFCSYSSWLKKEGAEWLDSCFEFYPIIDFIVSE